MFQTFSNFIGIKSNNSVFASYLPTSTSKEEIEDVIYDTIEDQVYENIIIDLSEVDDINEIPENVTVENYTFGLKDICNENESLLVQYQLLKKINLKT